MGYGLDVADLPNRDELLARWRAAALAVPNTRISPREIDRAGSDLNLLANAAVAMAEEIVFRAARAYAACFEDTAVGEELDRVIFDRKGLPRVPASPAVGQVQLTRASFLAGAGTIDGGLPSAIPPPTRIRTNRGVTYFLTQPAIFGALDLGPITVNVQSELAGLDQEVAENQSWNFVDAVFDQSIVISNPVEMAGASNEETDPAFRERAKGFFPTLRRGTLAAIDFGSISTPGVASVAVSEYTTLGTGLPAGAVEVFVLDALGQANQSLAARALLNLLEFRAAGIPVIANAGIPQYIPITFRRFDFDTALVNDTVAAENAVRTAVIGTLQDQRPGQTLLRSTIIAAAQSVRGALLDVDDLIDPAGSLIPATTNSAFRTLPELITFVD